MAYNPKKDETDYQTESDARTLKEHAEITSDPKRHQKAVDHLSKTNESGNNAEKSSRKLLEKNTKARLKEAFDSEGGKTNGGKPPKKGAKTTNSGGNGEAPERSEQED